MKRTKQVKRGLIYFAVALVLSIANIALSPSETKIDNAVDAQLTVVAVQQADLK